MAAPGIASQADFAEKLKMMIVKDTAHRHASAVSGQAVGRGLQWMVRPRVAGSRLGWGFCAYETESGPLTRDRGKLALQCLQNLFKVRSKLESTLGFAEQGSWDSSF